MKTSHPPDLSENAQKKATSVPYRMTDQRLKQLKHIATDRSTSVQQLIDEALDVFLFAPAQNSALFMAKSLAFETGEEDNLKLSERVRKLLRMLIAVFGSGKDDAIRAVTENIEVFYRYIGGEPSNVVPIDFVPVQRAAPAARAESEDEAPRTELGESVPPPGGGGSSKSRLRPRGRTRPDPRNHRPLPGIA